MTDDNHTSNADTERPPDWYDLAAPGEYYSLLELGEPMRADMAPMPDAVRAAYRVAVVTNHPELCRSTDLTLRERAHRDRLFRSIEEAYAVLSSPFQKAEYDQDPRGWIKTRRQPMYGQIPDWRAVLLDDAWNEIDALEGMVHGAELLSEATEILQAALTLKEVGGGPLQFIPGYALDSIDECNIGDRIERLLSDAGSAFAPGLGFRKIGYRWRVTPRKLPDGRFVAAEIKKATREYRECSPLGPLYAAEAMITICMPWFLIADERARDETIAHELMHLGVNDKQDLILIDHTVATFVPHARLYGCRNATEARWLAHAMAHPDTPANLRRFATELEDGQQNLPLDFPERLKRIAELSETLQEEGHREHPAPVSGAVATSLPEHGADGPESATESDEGESAMAADLQDSTQ